LNRAVERRERDAALRRDIILQAAVERIAADGLDAMTLAGLAHETGLSERTVGKLFLRRENILLESCEHHMDALVAAAEAADLPAVRTRRRLDALAIGLAAAIGERQAAHRTLAIGLVHLPAKMLLDISRKQNWLATLFADAIAACLPEGTHKPKFANAAVNSLLALLLADRPEPLARGVYARFCVTCTLEGLRRAVKGKEGKASF